MVTTVVLNLRLSAQLSYIASFKLVRVMRAPCLVVNGFHKATYAQYCTNAFSDTEYLGIASEFILNALFYLRSSTMHHSLGLFWRRPQNNFARLGWSHDTTPLQ